MDTRKRLVLSGTLESNKQIEYNYSRHSMIRTFIYGDPHGFDFYEKDAALNNYFKGFYISSRRGRRLMVNRRDNGDTIYNYLQYNLKEVIDRPTHAFFGMSVIIDDYEYCPNFKILLEWFDFLFDKLLNERQLFKTDNDGRVRYQVHKFSDNPSDAEWLKLNLPNIFTSGRAKLEKYDKNVFGEGKAGQVVSFKSAVSEKRLFEAFKKYNWISITAEIVEQEDSESGLSEEIELDYNELDGKLNEYNQRLLPVAVDVSKAVPEELNLMDSDVQEICVSLSSYIPRLFDAEETDLFRNLSSKYESLKSSIGAVISKMEASDKETEPVSTDNHKEEPKEQTQYCFSCKQHKPLSHFRSEESTKCIECEEQEQKNIQRKSHKRCVSCGKIKPISVFQNPGTDICTDCEKKQKREKEIQGNITWSGLKDLLSSKIAIGGLAAVAVIVCIVILIKHIDTPQVVDPTPEDTATVVTPPAVIDDSKEMVDVTILEELINKKAFEELAEYVKDKGDAANYLPQLKSLITDSLWHIIDAPTSKTDKKNEIDRFKLLNPSIIELVGINDKDITYWKETVIPDYLKMDAILRAQSITEEQYEEASRIIDRYDGRYSKELLVTLKAKIHIAPPPTPVASVKVTRFGADGASELNSQVIKNRQNVQCEIGTYVELVSSGETAITKGQKKGSFEENPQGKGKLRLKITGAAGDYTVYKCGKIVITITAKEKQKQQGKFHKQ